MSTEFSDLGLRPELVQTVAELGYVTPTPIQAGLIPVMLSGQDVLGQAQTGTGKTAAFALPLLHNLQPERGAVQALVLAPTRELAMQVAEAITQYGRDCRVRVLAVYGGQAYRLQLTQLKRGVDIVVGTPGRLMDLMRQEALDISRVRTVVLDEADEMLSMGFIEDIETILAATPAERQTALFSATLPAEIRRLAERYMRSPQSITVERERVTVDAIAQRFYLVNYNDKTAALTRLFEVEEISSALIFVRTRVGAATLANELTARGYPAETLSGDLNQEARERTLARFRQNLITVLVATDVAARGLDIDDISHVFNFDLPDDPEIYVHRIGRTGRAGKTGVAISLVSPFERRMLHQIEVLTRHKLERATLPSEEDIRSHREQKLAAQVTVWLQRGRYKAERALVEKMVAEGHDPLEIAAAALKVARADEKQRPIAALSEVVEMRSARPVRTGKRNQVEPEPRPYRPHGSAAPRSHEQGMVRLSLSLGRKHGVRPNDIVGALAAHTNIPGNTIGKILIEDRHSLVDVPEDLLAQVMRKSNGLYIRKQLTDVQIQK